MIRIGDEKPLSASLVVRTPVAVRTMREDKATISPRTLPQINMAIVIINTIIVMVMNLLYFVILQRYYNITRHTKIP